MPPSEDKIREVLKQVVDPELFVNVVDLGLIYGIEIRPHGEMAEQQSAPGEAGTATETTSAASPPALPEHEPRAAVAQPPQAENADRSAAGQAPAPHTETGQQTSAEQTGATGQVETAGAAAAGESGSKAADEGRQWDVTIEMTLTSPACPVGPQLIQHAKAVVGRLEGVANVEVKLVMQPPWTPDRMTDEARDQLGIF